MPKIESVRKTLIKGETTTEEIIPMGLSILNSTADIGDVKTCAEKEAASGLFIKFGTLPCSNFLLTGVKSMIPARAP